MLSTCHCPGGQCPGQSASRAAAPEEPCRLHSPSGARDRRWHRPAWHGLSRSDGKTKPFTVTPADGTVLQAHFQWHEASVLHALPGGVSGTVGQPAWCGAGNHQPVLTPGLSPSTLLSPVRCERHSTGVAAGAGAGGAEGGVTVPKQGVCDRHIHRSAGKVTLTWGSCLGKRQARCSECTARAPSAGCGGAPVQCHRRARPPPPASEDSTGLARAAGVRPSG